MSLIKSGVYLQSNWNKCLGMFEQFIKYGERVVSCYTFCTSQVRYARMQASEDLCALVWGFDVQSATTTALDSARHAFAAVSSAASHKIRKVTGSSDKATLSLRSGMNHMSLVLRGMDQAPAYTMKELVKQLRVWTKERRLLLDAIALAEGTT
ncbi:hypothetical protein FA95DRAFT_926202 [Auriscalpium vulgare]|uniref:Uncharacterized protein n=1 Tax=Auriscalpium vulgare TaxID=40419 RepID=A0ACB8R851_9AGAM|nr:hypothetical protein FA95DRAFT_926202 [Auriscalpium vulgare]